MARRGWHMLLLLQLFGIVGAVWIGEEYWARVLDDGTLADGTQPEALIRFDVMHHGVTMQNAYIAFWIQSEVHTNRHYETFGHAYIDQDGRMSARFVGPHGNPITRRGGFHVLRRSTRTGDNPFHFVKAGDANLRSAVGYLEQSVAMILNENRDEAFFGWVRLAERQAGGVDFEEGTVQIDGNTQPSYFDENIYVLATSDVNDMPAPQYEERRPLIDDQSCNDNPLRCALIPAKRQTQHHRNNNRDTNCQCGQCQDCGRCTNCETRSCGCQVERPSTPCQKCKPCKECEKCPECEECPECPDCPNCRECPECKPCKKCEKCPECKECPKCPNCPGCRECPDCEPCPPCNECPQCPQQPRTRCEERTSSCTNCQQSSGCPQSSSCGTRCATSKCGDCNPCTSNCKRSPEYPQLPLPRPLTTSTTTTPAPYSPQQPYRRCNSCGCQDYPQQPQPTPYYVFTQPPPPPPRKSGCGERQNQYAVPGQRPQTTVKPIGCRLQKRAIDTDYWVMVDRYGYLEPDRSKDELLLFDAIHKREPDYNAYVALWMQEDDHAYDRCVQRESFGHAFYDGDRLLGRFIDSNDQAQIMIGGFYVLAKSKRTGGNPFIFVQSREMTPTPDEYPARISSYQQNEAWFGSVDLGTRQARGVDYHRKPQKICGIRDPRFYDEYVYVLKKQNVNDKEDYESNAGRPYEVPEDKDRNDEWQEPDNAPIEKEESEETI